MGKVGISDMILKKPARLDEGEFKIMKQHTVFGAHLFLGCHSDFNQAAMVVALNHHERWDGKGYPGHINIADGTPLNGYARKGGGAKGKQRDEIPLFGRIVAVADVYDALSSKRIYKDAWDEASVLEALEQGAGRHFDPELIEIFIKKLDNMRAIQERYKDEKNSGDT
jgi:response regulator RpfG family c-di-GMP phosphodiesterase